MEQNLASSKCSEHIANAIPVSVSEDQQVQQLLPPGWIAIPLPKGGFVYQNTANPLQILTHFPDRVALLEAAVEVLKVGHYETDWMSAHSHEDNMIEIVHNRNAYPKGGMTVLFSPTNPASVVYDVSCSNYSGDHTGYNSAFHTGTFEYGLNYVKVPIWSGGVIGRHWETIVGWKTWKSGFLKFIIHF
jgi:hypothetical protein